MAFKFQYKPTIIIDSNNINNSNNNTAYGLIPRQYAAQVQQAQLPAPSTSEHTPPRQPLLAVTNTAHPARTTESQQLQVQETTPASNSATHRRRLRDSTFEYAQCDQGMLSRQGVPEPRVVNVAAPEPNNQDTPPQPNAQTENKTENETEKENSGKSKRLRRALNREELKEKLAALKTNELTQNLVNAAQNGFSSTSRVVTRDLVSARIQTQCAMQRLQHSSERWWARASSALKEAFVQEFVGQVRPPVYGQDLGGVEID